jgi:hypothetical protein
MPELLKSLPDNTPISLGEIRIVKDISPEGTVLIYEQDMLMYSIVYEDFKPILCSMETYEEKNGYRVIKKYSEFSPSNPDFKNMVSTLENIIKNALIIIKDTISKIEV